eukprot:365308_1
MSQTQIDKWNKLAECPFNETVRFVFRLNEKELLILLQTAFVGLRIGWFIGLAWTYNIQHNTYHKKNLLSTKLFKNVGCKYATTALDTNKSLLYLFGENGHVNEVNLKTLEWKKCSHKFHDGSHARSLFIKGKFHIFGGWENVNSHFIWCPKEQNLKKICDLKTLKPGAVRMFDMHYLKSRDSVLLLYGKRQDVKLYKDYGMDSKLYLYSLLTKQCESLPIKLLINIKFSESVLTRDEKYVILCGGGHFYVVNLKEMSIIKKEISVPCIQTGKMIIVSDEKVEELLSFGYIRNCWNLPSFSNIIYPPFYLTQLMNSYFTKEMIHMISAASHFSINVDKIIV